MAYTLILGPMKSGKSLELIARTAPYEFAELRVLYIKPQKDVRNDHISSRLGLNSHAVSVSSLRDVKADADVISVDEFHMFPEADAEVVWEWRKAGKEIIISGLDMDYSGTLTPLAKALLEAKPDHVIYKKSVCEACHKYNAQFTQILNNGKPVLGGLPSIVPEDGTYVYEPRCFSCFVKTT